MSSSSVEIHLSLNEIPDFIFRMILDNAEESDLSSNDRGDAYKFWVDPSEAATPEMIKSQIELGESYSWMYVLCFYNHFYLIFL